MRAPMSAGIAGVALSLLACGGGGRTVVVYTSVDQVFAEPLLAEFEKQTGIRPRAVFDVEANKTVGLANRLIAERNRPQADVFWNNEFLQTMRLKASGVLAASKPEGAGALDARWKDPDGVWYGCGARIRVLLAREGAPAPSSLRALSEQPQRLKSFGMALPLFGTTVTHMAALWSRWGGAETLDWIDRLQAGGARIADGNATVRDLVVQGQLDLALTDSDDACTMPAGAKATIHALPAGEALFIPGTVAMVAGAPHAEQGLALINWLLRPETGERLIELGASQISLHDPARRASCLEGLMIAPPEASLAAIEAAADAAREAMQARFRR